MNNDIFFLFLVGTRSLRIFTGKILPSNINKLTLCTLYVQFSLFSFEKIIISKVYSQKYCSLISLILCLS